MLKNTIKISYKFCLQKPQPQAKIIEINKKFTFKDFSEITKMKLSVANTLVALPLFLKYNPNDLYLIPFSVATQFMAMATQTANQAIEVDYDKQMVRTCRRPLPLKKINKKAAQQLSFAIWASSNLIFYNCFNLNSMIVGNTIFVSYVFMYTPMKRQTPLNTMFGAVVGALPVYLGYTASGGSLFDIEPLCQFGYMFAWQFAHFYGILWTYKSDYDKAGFKMMQDPNQAVTQMKYSTIIAIASSIGLGPYIENNFYHIFEISMILSLYKWAWEPLLAFKKNPGVESAKMLKRNSYYHFMVFWLFVYGDITIEAFKRKYKKYQEKKEQQQQIENIAVQTN